MVEFTYIRAYWLVAVALTVIDIASAAVGWRAGDVLGQRAYWRTHASEMLVRATRWVCILWFFSHPSSALQYVIAVALPVSAGALLVTGQWLLIRTMIAQRRRETELSENVVFLKERLARAERIRAS